MLDDENATNPQYYFQDDLGSPIRLFDETGTLTDTYGYDEFGQDLYHNQGERQPFGYTGYQQDGVAGTYYAQAREYQAGIGRFAGQDLIKGFVGEPKTNNAYLYCWAAPLNYVDLDGEFIFAAIGIAAAVGAAVSATVNVVTQVSNICRGKQKDFKWGSFAGSLVEGAVIGGASAIPGIGLAGTMIAGTVAGGLGSVVSQGIDDHKVDGLKVMEDAVVGGITGGVSYGITKGIGKIVKPSGTMSEIQRNILAKEAHAAKTAAIKAAGKTPSGLTRRAGEQIMQTGQNLFKQYIKENAIKTAIKSGKNFVYCYFGIKAFKEFLKDILPIDQIGKEVNLEQYYGDYFSKIANSMTDIQICIEE